MSGSLFEMQFPAVSVSGKGNSGKGNSGKAVVARFDGGEMTSDAGFLLLREADDKLRLTQRLAESIVDKRQASKVVHSALDLLRERIFAIAAGYEDTNDLKYLSRDPALQVSCDKHVGHVLGSQPTQCRFENEAQTTDLLCLAETLAQVVVEQLPSRTRSVVLDVDTTDDPCHGQQELQFFNAYYDEHCFHPLYLHITAEAGIGGIGGGDGVQRLMAAMLRPGNAGAKKGLFGLLYRAIKLLRHRFPSVKIHLRADGAFGDGEVLDFCEEYGLSYTLGLRSNAVLRRCTEELEAEIVEDTEIWDEDQRDYEAFRYRAGPWSRARRVVAKVETVQGKLNVRYVLTSRPRQDPERVYAFYCGRGDQENRIKEMKLDLAAGRTSCHGFWANQFRLILHTAACVIWRAVQDALRATCWAALQIGTLRLMVVKIGARVVETSRKIWLRLPTSCPYQTLWRHLWGRLQPPEPA
jgi:hypothetical protein